MSLIDEVEARARVAFRPPPKLAMSEWLEANVRLPSEVSALQGPLELWPFQHEIANAMADPRFEKVTLVKATRLGFSTLLTGAIGAYAVNDPSPILMILPTSDDCRDYVTSELDPIFATSPTLRDALKPDPGETDRNILMSRRFAGGFLKIIATRAPRYFAVTPPELSCLMNWTGSKLQLKAIRSNWPSNDRSATQIGN